MIDHVTDLFFGHQLVYQLKRTGRIVRQQISQLCTTRGCFDHLHNTRSIFAVARWDTGFYLGMQAYRAIAKRKQDFLNIREHHALALFIVAFHRHVIKAKNDILRRHNDWLTVCRAQNVVCRHHQYAGFKLSLKRQRHMDRHLVAVKVSIKRGTNKRVQLDCLAFDKNRLKGLNAKTVQSWRTVQHDRMFANDFFKNIPNFRTFLFDHAFGHFNGAGKRI